MHSYVKALALGASLVFALTATASAKTPHLHPFINPGSTAASKAQLAALVGSDGTVWLKKGVVAVTHDPSSGIYCLFPNNVTLTNQIPKLTPQVTLDFGTSPDTFATAQYNSGITFLKTCPTNALEVRTFNNANSTVADEGFTIIVW
jgi:hypothetical protein